MTPSKDHHMKKTLKVLGIVIVALILINILILPFAMIGMKEIKNLSIENPDLSTFKDSKYTGSYGKGRWNYKVSVTLKNKKITDIKIDKSKLPTPEKLNKAIIQRIIDKQSISLDAVSGASINTKALCKAVELAFASN